MHIAYIYVVSYQYINDIFNGYYNFYCFFVWITTPYSICIIMYWNVFKDSKLTNVLYGLEFINFELNFLLLYYIVRFSLFYLRT